MKGNQILKYAIEPAFELLGHKYASDRARVMMLAIGYQESRFEHRRQIGGPARGFWQFEKGGGVHGVMSHHASKEAAAKICAELGYDGESETAIYMALADNDILAASFARLLLWTSPESLPAIGDKDHAWDYYMGLWRPGKPHPATWEMCYNMALDAM